MFQVFLFMEVQFLPGRYKGKDVTVVDVFEAVGKHSSGQMSSEELRKLELVACPSAGACGGQFTANTMACVSEAIGLALPILQEHLLLMKKEISMHKAVENCYEFNRKKLNLEILLQKKH